MELKVADGEGTVGPIWVMGQDVTVGSEPVFVQGDTVLTDDSADSTRAHDRALAEDARAYSALFEED